MTDTIQFYWRPGDPLVRNAYFVCVYRDRSELTVPIGGALLRCRTLSARLQDVEHPRTWCFSEIEPENLPKR